MIAFVGLRWDPACLEFHRTKRSVSTFSKWQVRQKITKSSVERWRNYAPFVEPLLRLCGIAQLEGSPPTLPGRTSLVLSELGKPPMLGIQTT